MALFSKETPAPSPSRPNTPQHSGGGTFIGVNVTVDGTVTGTEPVVVEGTLHGKVDLGADLRIGTKGRGAAQVHARNVMVEGTVNGDISADERLELIATAVVEGNLKAPKIVVAEGAKFRGSVDMGGVRPNADEQQSETK
jgi:cytoskeletal protein CcmA (bactofilin family)